MTTATHAREVRTTEQRPVGQRWGLAVVAGLPALLVTLALPLAIEGSLAGFILLPFVLLVIAITTGVGGVAGIAVVLVGTVTGAVLGTGSVVTTPLLGGGLAGVLLFGTWLGQALAGGRWPVAAGIPSVGLMTGILALGVTGRLEAGVLAAFTGLSLSLLLVLVGPWNGPSAVRPARWAEVLAVFAMAASALATYTVSVSSAPLVGEARTADLFSAERPTSRTDGGVPDPFLTAARWQLEPGYDTVTLFAIAGPEALEQRPTWATFSTYNGIAWLEPPTYGVPGDDIPPERVGAPRRTFDTGARVTVAVGLPGQWVPVPQRVNNVVSGIETRADPASGIVAAVSSPIDNSFDIGFSLAVADRAELDATFPAQGGPDDPALALPAPISGRLLELADRVSATSPNTWTRLVTLAQELRADVFTAAPPSALGVGAPDRTYAGLDRVLAEGVGFQEQFAAIWAIIARSWDIPTRLVIGFPLEADGPPVRAVNADHVSIWAEARLDGLGWVAFQPSPQDRDAGRKAVVRPLTPEQVPTLPDGNSGGTSGGGQLPDGGSGGDTEQASGDGASDGLAISWPLLGVVAAVLAVIAWILGVAIRRRRIRARLDTGSPRERAHGAWTWARLILAEAWMPLPIAYAPALDVERPSDLPDDVADTVHDLAREVAPLIYGSDPSDAGADAAWVAADALARAVQGTTGWRTGLRRRVVPLEKPPELTIRASQRGVPT